MDLCPNKALVYDVPGNKGLLPDVLPAPHLSYAWPSDFCSEVVRLPRQ